MRLDEMMQGQIPGGTMQPQVFGAPTNPEMMSSEEIGTFRPMMDGFENMTDMMAMDLHNGDDDFWWTRSWGTVRIL
jgi:hypothetical protein